MDLLKLELEQGRLPQDFLSQLKPISSANAPKINSLREEFGKVIRSVFESPDEELFRAGMKLLENYSDLDEDFELKEYVMYADDDDYEEFASNFGSFKDFVFSKEGVRGLTSSNWSDGVAFTYRLSEGVLELYVPSYGKDLGIIKISANTQAKLTDIVKKANAMTSGKTFFTDGSGEFVIGK
jgi:hypothetical protein